jgi:hypothetical protein
MLGGYKYIRLNRLVPDPSPFEFEIAIAKVKSYK